MSATDVASTLISSFFSNRRECFTCPFIFLLQLLSPALKWFGVPGCLRQCSSIPEKNPGFLKWTGNHTDFNSLIFHRYTAYSLCLGTCAWGMPSESPWKWAPHIKVFIITRLISCDVHFTKRPQFQTSYIKPRRRLEALSLVVITIPFNSWVFLHNIYRLYDNIARGDYFAAHFGRENDIDHFDLIWDSAKKKHFKPSYLLSRDV